jgi:hypothetical protein
MTYVTTSSNEAVHCPRCGSVNVHAEKRGWSLATGFIRSNQLLLTCLKCSKRFRPERLQRPFWQVVLILAVIVFFGWMLTGHSHAQSTTQRDAPTTRFYTPNGSSAGSATTYGNTTTFYGANGGVTGRATRQGQR